ncbi:transposase IS4 [Nitzschia inconspicua]|uniref:Transposase IS4 n=1 Tax=Nitzschia inconspicua TaxID=303405 RepID=A0A9K3LC71_9STRA|nr:transposase IS4 [Nitzschia inconspicua]
MSFRRKSNLISVGVDDRFLLRNDGFNVDDDRDPAPENIPVPGETLNDQQTWGWGGRCHRKVFGAADDKPKLIQLTDSESKLMTILSLFLCLFPATYLDEVLLAEINRNLDKEKARRIGLGEFLRFLGLWYYMATFKGVTRAQFWSTKDIDPYSGALIRFHKMMSKQRFDLILKSLRYTNRLAPAYKDKFHGIRQLIEAWNDNMIKKFRPSWVSCLDESMSPWTTRWTCPGWTYVPRKPTPMGNEYHSVCCGVSKIMWQIELVEGKDAPRERVPPANAGAGKTCFCVLQGLIELRKIGIFASAVIKKRRYWPKHVPGGILDQHMSTKQVGEVDSLKGELDNIPYDLFCMKDADFTMKLMSTYGSPIPLRDAKEKRRRVDGEVKTFKYTETFENHYRYRHAVDDHNNLRHSDISLEETWVTHRWENRAFAFILAITETAAGKGSH